MSARGVETRQNCVGGVRRPWAVGAVGFWRFRLRVGLSVRREETSRAGASFHLNAGSPPVLAFTCLIGTLIFV